MRRVLGSGAVVLAVLFALSGAAVAQSTQDVLIPGYEPARDVPGAKELVDPNMTYKVVFDVTKAAPKIGDVNPGLAYVVRYLNTLAKNGVPAERRKIAVVLHGDAAEIVLNSAAFKAAHDGQDNPNIALIQSMKKAGIDLRVNGQALQGKKLDQKSVLPEVEIDFWTPMTMGNLELRGYVHLDVN